jgi:proteasome accessory factor A
MSETTTLLKIGTVDLLLRMIEAGTIMRDLRLENPIRSIRDISHDLSGSRPLKLANGKEMSAVQMQQEYLAKAKDFVDEHGAHNPHVPRILDLWERTLDAIASGNHDAIAREIDWAIKKRLIERVQARHGLSLESARLAQLDLTYHDISRTRGLFYLLQNRGEVDRVVDDADVKSAVDTPPQTTRAKLRGDFVRAAREHGRDFTVDWVHLKLNDRSQQTILCKDPFRSTDERVDSLLASL